MRMFFRSLVALAYLVSATIAQAGFLINSFQIAAPPATISFIGCTLDQTDATTYTYTNHATGTAGNRWTIVGTSPGDGAINYSTSSMTVGGNAATEVVDTANASSFPQNAIYIIENPTGTTATISVTYSEAVLGSVICVWAAYDLQSATAHDTANQFQTSSASIDLSLDVPTDGIAVGMSSQLNNNDQDVTWTGMTERSETFMVDTSYEASSADTSTAGTPRTVSADWTGTNDSIGVSASFR